MELLYILPVFIVMLAYSIYFIVATRTETPLDVHKRIVENYKKRLRIAENNKISLRIAEDYKKRLKDRTR